MRARTLAWARAATVIALAAPGAVACGTTSIETESGPERRVEPTPRVHGIELPPDMRVHYGDQSIDLRPWTFCYLSTCADGAPPRKLPDVGSPEQVVVEFPLEGWRLRADFEATGKPCPRSFPTGLEEIEPGRFLLMPAGYAGEYDVTLTARGPDGDAFTSFHWTTPSDGPLPTPSAWVGIIADNDGAVTSYGVEMQVRQLAVGPEDADASITVTAADGDSLTFSPRLTDDCSGDGELYWDGPDAKGKEAARLGPAPFTYDVALTLDGQTYDASATWPDDVIGGFAPAARLDFSPALPALN
ncbi:MAG TPA: hypothetical protein VKB55_20570 [Nocardioidaceae bacterium]|nr:hypothetical protein [Nocardioidaceae bacterium]